MKGVVAAGDRTTAEAAAEVLRLGGNAFDAAVAACFTAPISEPALTSAGGGGFLLAVSKDSPPLLYDFFVDVPPKRTESPDFYPVEVDFGDAKQVFHVGAGSVAVPGFVAGLLRVHSERGKLPLKEVLSVPIEYARRGIRLSKLQASFVRLLEPIFTATEESRRVYAPGGKLISEKEVFRNPDYGEFLELLSKEGQIAFYGGEIADVIEKLMEEKGGLLRKEDLLRYKVFERKPIKVDFKGFKIFTNPPPSSGGILIAFSLKLLSKVNLGNWGSVEHAGALIESIRTTQDFRKDYVNGHLHDRNLKRLLDEENVTNRYLSSFKNRLNLWGNTTHVCVLDGEGNGVSVTTTNGEGSGVVVPETGVMLNNMLGEEDLNPLGFFKWKPYVRLPSMMSPTAVFRGKELSLLVGSAGSNRIRSAVIQTILNFLIFGMDLEEAVGAPRLHYENSEVFLEPGFPEETVEEIKKHYKTTVFSDKNLFFGGVQAVDGNFNGAGDPRRGGYVIHL